MPTPTLNDRLRADLNASRKNREKLRTLVLTTFISEIRNREIELGAEAPDEEVQRLLGRGAARSSPPVKTRKPSSCAPTFPRSSTKGRCGPGSGRRSPPVPPTSARS